MNRILGWTVAGVLSLGGIAGCSSDKAATPVAKTPAAPEATTAGAPSANPAVDTFCKEADDVATKLKAVLADPSNGDIAALSAAAAKLATDSASLISIQPAEAAKITACTQKLADAAKPGG
jgi:hypothetical protein